MLALLVVVIFNYYKVSHTKPQGLKPKITLGNFVEHLVCNNPILVLPSDTKLLC